MELMPEAKNASNKDNTSTDHSETGRFPRPWGPFTDDWKLVNASPEEIRQWAQQDPAARDGGWDNGWPDDQIELLTRVTDIMRQMLVIIARGQRDERHSALYKMHSEYTRLCSDLSIVEHKIPGDWVYISLPPHGDETGEWYNFGDDLKVRKIGRNRYVIRGRDGQKTVATGSMHKAVEQLLDSLLWRWWDGTESNLYVCEKCGKIGPAKQKNKRFCNSTCRVRAFREK